MMNQLQRALFLVDGFKFPVARTLRANHRAAGSSSVSSSAARCSHHHFAAIRNTTMNRPGSPENFSVKELKALLQERGLKVGGRKAELILRLKNHHKKTVAQTVTPSRRDDDEEEEVWQEAALQSAPWLQRSHRVRYSKLPHGDAWLAVVDPDDPNFPELRTNTEEEEFETLWSKQPSRVTIQMYGKTIDIPRVVKNYTNEPNGLALKVSGNTYAADPINKVPFAERILEFINQEIRMHDDEKKKKSSSPTQTNHPGSRYNSCLINWYDSTTDYIGWHGDKEKQIVSTTPIISLSFGATRRFRIRSERTTPRKKWVFDEDLHHGTIVVMGGSDFQTQYKHTVPKRRSNGVDDDDTRRINLTLRQYKSN